MLSTCYIEYSTRKPGVFVLKFDVSDPSHWSVCSPSGPARAPNPKLYQRSCKRCFQRSNSALQGLSHCIAEHDLFTGSYGYGSIPINTIFRGMNIHLPAILMFTRGTRFWHTAIFVPVTRITHKVDLYIGLLVCWARLRMVEFMWKLKIQGLESCKAAVTMRWSHYLESVQVMWSF